MTRANRYGVYFIFKSMEQGSTFRITVPKYPTADPNYRILAHQRSRFTHYYFYIRDEVLGPMVSSPGFAWRRVGSFIHLPGIGVRAATHEMAPINPADFLHLFTVGQAVRLRSGFRGPFRFAGIHHITGTLPPMGDLPQYRIRSDDEHYERVTTQES